MQPMQVSVWKQDVSKIFILGSGDPYIAPNLQVPNLSENPKCPHIPQGISQEPVTGIPTKFTGIHPPNSLKFPRVPGKEGREKNPRNQP